MIQVKVYHQRNLDEQDNRNSVFELPMQRLMIQAFIPNQAPILPPTAAIVRSVASEIRHLAFLALYLSIPYMINVAALMTSR